MTRCYISVNRLEYEHVCVPNKPLMAVNILNMVQQFIEINKPYLNRQFSTESDANDNILEQILYCNKTVLFIYRVDCRRQIA